MASRRNDGGAASVTQGVTSFRADMTLRETGAALRVGRGPVSRQRTEQIEKLALAKLRRWFLRHAPWVRS
jgi:DNA-directed RNA polymerase sigma subunit (sigma70/sigma32)